MSLRKVFSIVIASIALYLFINMFFPYLAETNTWDMSAAVSVFLLINIIGIIAVYVLNIFGVLKERWVTFANYATGFVTIFHFSFFFWFLDEAHVGLWLGAIFSLFLLAASVLWWFFSDKPFASKGPKGKITGYDPASGKPIYAKPKGFDPETGKPIYE